MTRGEAARLLLAFVGGVALAFGFWLVAYRVMVGGFPW